MSIETTRGRIAEALTTALDAWQVTVHKYRPHGKRAFNGWLELTQVDQVDATYGEVRCLFDVVILVATNQTDFEKVLDKFAPVLVEACNPLGRGVTVRPYTEKVDSTTLFCVVASMITESEVA